MEKLIGARRNLEMLNAVMPVRCIAQMTCDYGTRKTPPISVGWKNLRGTSCVGVAGASEAEFRTNLTNAHGFYEGDVNALCASPTVRQLIGW